MAKQPEINNPDYLPIAFYLVGAVGQFVDVEDAFVRCWELAPERFGWRKHKYPDLKRLSKALRDLEERNPTLLLKTPDGNGRQLTSAGLSWVKEHLPRFESLSEHPELVAPMRRPVFRRLNELASHPVVAEYTPGSTATIEKHVAADLLLCSPDSPPDVWRERLESFRVAAEFGKRPDLVQFLDELAANHAKWFGR